jgi:hypothetical protein
MDVLEELRRMVGRYRQLRAEREALRILIERRDRRLLRDAGLTLLRDGGPRCEPLPQTKERRWRAPLARRLSPPFPLRQAGGDAAPSSGRSTPAKGGRLFAWLPPHPQTR